MGDLEATVTVVLVRPARGENIGAACRALKNMGLGRLGLVEPAPAASEPTTRNSAYGAWDLLDAAVRYSSIREAVAGSHVVIGTSGRPASRNRDVRGLGDLVLSNAKDGRSTALLFGPESSGLADSELALCHHVVHIPSAPEQPSLNLAQAVLLAGWEIRRRFLEDGEGEGDAPSGASAAATVRAGDLEGCLDGWRSALAGVGYLNPQNPDRILSECRALLVRARLTPRELSLLRGMARQIGWALRKIRAG